MNNSVFGKTVENIRNMVDIRLISSDKVAQKLADKPNYDHCTIFDENLIAAHMKKTKLFFDKPVYLGILTWVNPWCMTIITTILRLNMKIMQNYSLPTLTNLHMKLRPKIFTKISTLTLRNGLTIVTIQVIIHLEFKQDLIIKCLECFVTLTNA